MNWRKAAAWSAGAIVLLGAVGVAALHALVDSERLRKAAVDHARTAWERELLMGDVAFTFWPVPAITATKVSLADPPWCRLLNADQVRADIALLPLAMGEVRFKRVLLQGARAGFEDGELWQIEEALIESQPGYRDVRIDARVSRHGQPLGIKAEFADLSRLGLAGATTEGKVELEWKQTHAAATGHFPLAKGLEGQAVMRAELKSASIADVFKFFGIKRGATAPVQIHFEARAAQGGIQIADLKASLGKLTVTGDMRVAIKEDKAVIDARLATDRLDWLQTHLDAGGAARPKRSDEEIFHDYPVPWPMVDALGALEGTAELSLKSLKLRNGLELTHTKARMAMGGGRMALSPFTTAMLGGTAKGSLKYDPRKQTVQAKIEGEGLLLERWLRERGSKVPFTGGTMAIAASLTLTGATHRDFAASVTGPVTIRMGRGSWNSKRAGEYESMMVSALASRQSEEITIECASADLDFKTGRATGKRLIGARSNVSQLLTEGFVDFREEVLDLRGRVKASSGASVGLAMFAGDVQIHGKLKQPKVRMDPDGKPAMVARVAAAIATSGVTLVGAALLDAGARSDPCKAVFGGEGNRVTIGLQDVKQ